MSADCWGSLCRPSWSAGRFSLSIPYKSSSGIMSVISGFVARFIWLTPTLRRT
jgi:hypothetical protein